MQSFSEGNFGEERFFQRCVFLKQKLFQSGGALIFEVDDDGCDVVSARGPVGAAEPLFGGASPVAWLVRTPDDDTEEEGECGNKQDGGVPEFEYAPHREVGQRYEPSCSVSVDECETARDRGGIRVVE